MAGKQAPYTETGRDSKGRPYVVTGRIDRNLIHAVATGQVNASLAVTPDRLTVTDPVSGPQETQLP